MEGVLFGIGMFVISLVVGTIVMVIKILFKSRAIYPIMVMIVFSLSDKGIDAALFNRKLSYLKDADPKMLLKFIVILAISMIPMIVKIIKTLRFVPGIIKDFIDSIVYRFPSIYKKILKKE